MIIRPECVNDYAAIAALNARAFGNRSKAAAIVALKRQNRAFDPELSLMAEIDGRIVGHVLFSPHRMRLLDQTIPAVNLAPIAVDPAYQGQSIGGRLISEGHAIAAAKGYTVSMLLGHVSYYPRFGYRTNAYGSSRLVLSTETLPNDILDTRSPTHEDVPTLQELWHHEESAVDMALEPGPDLLDWLSPNPAIRASVYTNNNDIVGYTRIHANEATSPRVFLARDSESARAVVATIAHQRAAEPLAAEYILPLHPFSTSAQALGRATCTAWEAGMACSLGPSPLDDYLARVQNGQRPPGRPTWPVAFDLD